MRTITRTEITIETSEVIVMTRPGSVFQSWCGQCGERTGMIRIEGTALTGVSLENIRQRKGADTIHLIELAEGLTLICLNSLLKKI